MPTAIVQRTAQDRTIHLALSFITLFQKLRRTLELSLLFLCGSGNAVLAKDIPLQPGPLGYTLCQPYYLTAGSYRVECEQWQEGQFDSGDYSCDYPKLPFPWDSEALLIPKSVAFYEVGEGDSTSVASATGKGWLDSGQTGEITFAGVGRPPTATASKRPTSRKSL